MFELLKVFYDQSFPPKPTFEEKDVPDLTGKVYIVTGGASGVGYELVKILYSKNAKIYIGGRSAKNGETAISKLKDSDKDSKGALEFLALDLSDLFTLQTSANEFLQKEQRLDGIVHNAGVMICPRDWRTKQGWEMQLGTNVIGPFTFQKHLQNILFETAKTVPRNSVRVIWLSSSAAYTTHTPQGVDFDHMNEKGIPRLNWTNEADKWSRYSQTKCANNLFAKAYAQKFADKGIISLSLNPGNLKTPLQRHAGLAMSLIGPLILYQPRFGGLTELYALLSPDVNETNNGGFVAPWGRINPFKKSVNEFAESGGALKLWDWCEEQTKDY